MVQPLARSLERFSMNRQTDRQTDRQTNGTFNHLNDRIWQLADLHNVFYAIWHNDDRERERERVLCVCEREREREREREKERETSIIKDISVSIFWTNHSQIATLLNGLILILKPILETPLASPLPCFKCSSPILSAFVIPFIFD